MAFKGRSWYRTMLNSDSSLSLLEDGEFILGDAGFALAPFLVSFCSETGGGRMLCAVGRGGLVVWEVCWQGGLGLRGRGRPRAGGEGGGISDRWRALEGASTLIVLGSISVRQKGQLPWATFADVFCPSVTNPCASVTTDTDGYV